MPREALSRRITRLRQRAQVGKAFAQQTIREQQQAIFAALPAEVQEEAANLSRAMLRTVAGDPQGRTPENFAECKQRLYAWYAAHGMPLEDEENE